MPLVIWQRSRSVKGRIQSLFSCLLRYHISIIFGDYSGPISLTAFSGLIALTFVGQISHLGTAFFVFSLVVIPTLFFIGLITFERVLQSGSADFMYARGINCIRHLYLEYAPQMQPYFILSSHDDREETLGHEAMQTSWWQVFLNTAGMIAVINSVLVGSFVGLLLADLTLPLWVCTSVGVVTFLVSISIHQRYQWRQWMRLERNLPALFPS